MTDDGFIDSLKSIAARERANGNVELAGIIEIVAADQQEIMQINNTLRAALLQIGAVCDDNVSVGNTALALKFVREIVTKTVE